MNEYDIPVLFQVSAHTEDEAAEKVGYALGHAHLVNPDNGIESWHMPEHQSVDGSDSPVRVIVVGSIKDLRIPDDVKEKIEKVAAIIAESK